VKTDAAKSWPALWLPVPDRANLLPSPLVGLFLLMAEPLAGPGFGRLAGFGGCPLPLNTS
jgi:hypothetical protein